MKRGRPVKPWLCLILLALAPTVHARDFVVEIVLFEHRQPAGSVLPSMLYVPRTADAVSLGDERAVDADFRVLTDDELGLGDAAAAITASSRYRLLGHFGWQQPGLAADEVVPIRIGLGPLATLYIPPDIATYDRFVPAALQPEPDRERDIRIPTVYGVLKLRLGRFLHLETDLVYNDATHGRGYRLSQSRKMRSGELHYIDNERFGLLVLALPAEEAGATPQGPDDAAVDTSAPSGGTGSPNESGSGGSGTDSAATDEPATVDPTVTRDAIGTPIRRAPSAE